MHILSSLERSWSRLLGGLLVAVLASLVAACASPVAKAPLVSAPATNAYQLGAGDEIRLSVYGFDALTGPYVVNDQGAISLPLAGTITVAGKSVADAETAVAAALAERQIAVKPSVSLQVTKYRPFFILGEVQKPGSYAYAPGITVLNAISIAGGHTFRADHKAYGITRVVNGQTVKGRADDDTVVQPGDTLVVYEAWF